MTSETLQLKFSWLRIPDLVLLGEAGLTLMLTHLVVHLVSFRHIAPRLGGCDSADKTILNSAQQLEAERIARAVLALSRRRLFRPQCLARTMAGKLMLSRRGIGSTLYLGLRRRGGAVSPLDPAHDIVFHAWLKAGGMKVLGNGGGHRIIRYYS